MKNLKKILKLYGVDFFRYSLKVVKEILYYQEIKRKKCQ